MPIFRKEHADLVVALIGDKDDTQPIFGLMPQKIAVIHFDDSNACIAGFNDGTPYSAELVLIDATVATEETNKFLTEFRGNDAFENIPVVVMADSDDSATSEHFVGLGANFCISKLDVLADQSGLSQIITDYWMSG